MDGSGCPAPRASSRSTPTTCRSIPIRRRCGSCACAWTAATTRPSATSLTSAPAPATWSSNTGPLTIKLRNASAIATAWRVSSPSVVDAGTRRSAYFTNLPPGNYCFQVRACNADDVWNEEGASFRLDPAAGARPRNGGFALGSAAASLGLIGAVVGAARPQPPAGNRRDPPPRGGKLQMQMIESSPVAMLMLDNRHRVLYANATFTRVFIAPPPMIRVASRRGTLALDRWGNPRGMGRRLGSPPRDGRHRRPLHRTRRNHPRPQGPLPPPCRHHHVGRRRAHHRWSSAPT